MLPSLDSFKSILSGRAFFKRKKSDVLQPEENTFPGSSGGLSEIIDRVVALTRTGRAGICSGMNEVLRRDVFSEPASDERHTFVVLCYGRFISDNVLDAVSYHLKYGCRAVIFIDERDEYPASLKNKLNRLASFASVKVINIAGFGGEKKGIVPDFKEAKGLIFSDTSHAEVLYYASRIINTEFVTLLNAADRINPRSFIAFLNRIINGNSQADVFIPESIIQDIPDYVITMSVVHGYIHNGMSNQATADDSTGILKRSNPESVSDKFSRKAVLFSRLLAHCRKQWSVSDFSGMTLKTKVFAEALSRIDRTQNVLLSYEILKQFKAPDVLIYDNPLLIDRLPVKNVSLYDIGDVVNYIVRESGWDFSGKPVTGNGDKNSLINYHSQLDFTVHSTSTDPNMDSVADSSSNLPSDSDDQKTDLLFRFLDTAVNDIYSCNLQNIKRAWLYTAVAYVFYLAEINGMQTYTEKWKSMLHKNMGFSQKLTNTEIQRYAELFIQSLIKKGTSDVFVVENIGMLDIYNSVFFELLTDKYHVDYLIKRSNFDYYHFNNLIVKMHTRAATLTIGSGSLSREMLTDDDNHLTLWHGLGWMKKTEVIPEKFTVGRIVCSSEYCVERYKKHFFAEKALGLGSVQTDILLNQNFVNKYRNEIRVKYAIPDDAGIIVFAPTFRIGRNYQYYDLRMDIEILAAELEKHNLYVITKKHHILNAVYIDKGIDTSGVHTSANNHFIVDEEYDFYQLVVAADCFATDYSSSMYYAFIMNLPVFLYAPDVEEYKSGPNGFEIDYPDIVPVPFVAEPSPEKFVSAYYESLDIPRTERYQAYRKDNVGACDGRVGEKVFEYIKDNYFSGKYTRQQVR